ncbi:hypothetical protein C488_07622 [Natrinema pellirubrum DSM 15624]|uniref:DUF7344 domain-containing protein n=2 Tax=Natrinema TaxID=88723 RepID=L0JKS1_NATP1|nr:MULTISPECIES: hypothetical protein [Natrinema]ELZ15629.1 hypothetical protein C478_05269 [Natrinema thermotolerans DSM 11552]AGB32135.1 hypothetical protein Natpe_2315 [Natrinema pellirubrum DSM 15624]ELY76980.1 hypothetical protein C488_07622 [Natrinema pellirubrum DSM 15624]QCC60726.1 hypothetical protein DVR14_19630 [Natrinema thermotolerans]QCC61604.1 hypothetical protein DVR14_23760 [Natrinema thermotolerans]
MGGDRAELDPFALSSAVDDRPVDDVFRLLASPTARATIVYCHQQPSPAVEELADVIAGVAASADGTIASPADRDRIRIQLYHETLPRLEDMGLLAFDRESGDVTETSIPESILDCLRAVE